MDDGVIAVFPIDGGGVERKWRYERGTVEGIRNLLRVSKGRDGILGIQLAKATDKFKTVWYSPRYNAGDHGTNLCTEMGLAIGEFDYPKSIHTVRDCVYAVCDAHSVILDYFAGSGTTAHAVINLNRTERDGGRTFVLVEMANYFDTVLVPRVKKVTFTPEWANGKPKRMATSQEEDRSPRVVKVVRLESYEDTLNNLEVVRTPRQQELLDTAEAKGPDGFKEQYLLRYMLDVETRGSPSLLSVEGFLDPSAYRLKVKPPV